MKRSRKVAIVAVIGPLTTSGFFLILAEAAEPMHGRRQSSQVCTPSPRHGARAKSEAGPAETKWLGLRFLQNESVGL